MTDKFRARVDRERLWRLFTEFVAVDTLVPHDANYVDALDPRLARFATETVMPYLEEMGAEVSLDEGNNLIAQFGPLTGRELMFVAYPALHHGNRMVDALTGRCERRGNDETWVGLGASQGKGALAALLTGLHLLRSDEVRLEGRVVVVLSSEGRSSHESSKILYRRLSPLPAGAVLLVGTENRISLGNRGRLDIVIESYGKATHSSAVKPGQNPIPAIGECLERVAAITLDPTPHPVLGRRSLHPYKLVCTPIAPHTIPEHCVLILDRRLLPGDEPTDVLNEVMDQLIDLPVSVAAGPLMLPALVDEDATVVRLLRSASADELGRSLDYYYPMSTFDAGYGCLMGVPTVMFGPSSAGMDSTGVLGEDFVNYEDLLDATAVIASAISQVDTQSHR